MTSSRRRRRSAVAAAAVVLAVAAAAAPAVAETIVAQETRRTAVTAYGNWVVWSGFDATTSRYRLRAWNGTEVTTLPVPGRRIPFDADAGPAPGGRGISIVYSRCRREPHVWRSLLPDYVAGRGCDIYRYVLGSSGEMRLRTISSRADDEVLPAVWGSRVAFARSSRRRPSPTLNVTVGSGMRTIRGGTRVGGGAAVPAPTGIDLDATRLAFSWDRVADGGLRCAASRRPLPGDAEQKRALGRPARATASHAAGGRL